MNKTLRDKIPNTYIIRPLPLNIAYFDKISLRNVIKIALSASIGLFVVINLALGQSNTPSEPELTPADKSHWAFQPAKHRPLPTVKNPLWASNPIDFFILEKLDEKKTCALPFCFKRTFNTKGNS